MQAGGAREVSSRADRARSCLASSFDEFLARFPAYRTTERLDELRRTEYSRLDRLDHVYLDYTGGGLFAESQLREHHKLLTELVLGNPHSESPASQASESLIEQAREDVRRFFNAAPQEYEVIFVSNATAAIKLVGEAYPFDSQARLLLTYDNHNSVNGIRQFARANGATTTYIPVGSPDLRVDEDLLRQSVGEPRIARRAARRQGLFAYPAQSNFSGVQHSPSWIAEAQALGWDVMLDCAAFVPTNRLDLSRLHPDFVAISFYKMFGYPTGIGALIARREALARLRRPWFAGGTITVVSVHEQEWYHLAPPPAGFEDGTLDYLGLPAVSIGLRHLESIGVETIHTRVQCLSAWLLDELGRLRHTNGQPMVQIFGPRDMQRRGATIALCLLDPRGHPYDLYDVEAAAGRALISLRTGCFCNPGDGEVAHEITKEDMGHCFEDAHAVASLMTCQRTIEDATGKVLNTLRVSLGLVSNFADVSRFADFVRSYRDRSAVR